MRLALMDPVDVVAVVAAVSLLLAILLGSCRVGS